MRSTVRVAAKSAVTSAETATAEKIVTEKLGPVSFLNRKQIAFQLYG
jgi:hypothetical protein